MKALHITFRYGNEVYGGAELYLRHLSEELVRKGVDVDICTTRTHTLTPIIKSGTLFDNTLYDTQVRGLEVYRFPVKNPNKYISLLFDKLIQKELDKEESGSESYVNDTVEEFFTEPGGFLLSGWNQLERYNDFQMRWSKSAGVIVINDTGVRNISLTLHNPKGIPAEIHLSGGGYDQTLPVGRTDGWEVFSVDLPDVSGKLFITLRCFRIWRPLKDIRSLGVALSDVEYTTSSGIHTIDLEYDYRHLLVKHGRYIPLLLQNARTRPGYLSTMFDYLRGPDSASMERWLKKNIQDYDIVLAQMFPFNTIKYSLIALKQNIPLVLLPLMHIEDEFYHWNHYYTMLSMADCIFSMSAYSKEQIFNRFNPNCHDIGAGVSGDLFLSPDADGGAFREKYGLLDHDIILTVSRKASSKRYECLVRAMDEISVSHPDALLVMVGPDDDKRPIDSDHVRYLGKIDEVDLVNAYDACDLFAMMSESESFGMVFCEAWARKKPVIGSRHCGAVATLIEEGKDGLLSSDEKELVDAVSQLLDDRCYGVRLGQNGYDKVCRHYTWDAVAERALACYEDLLR